MRPKVTEPLIASLLSAATMSGLAILSINVFEADPQSVAVVAIFSSIIMACLLMAEGENHDRMDR